MPVLMHPSAIAISSSVTSTEFYVFNVGKMLFFIHQALLGATLLCSGDFGWHAENCWTMGMTESALFPTNKQCAFFFIVFYNSHIFYIAKPVKLCWHVAPQ